jgi:two-component system phosphate regulon sensor histidine kinase PhoR
MRPPAHLLSVRIALPLVVAAAACLGAVAGYLLTGDWEFSIVGAGLGAWLAALMAFESVSAFVDKVTGILHRIAGGDPGEALDPSRYEELSELGDSVRQVTTALAELVATASQDRSRLLAAMNSSSDAVVGVDRAGKVSFANVAAERLLARLHDDLIGASFAWLMPNAELVDALKASQKQGRPVVVTIERPNKQYLRATATPIVGGGDWAALVVFHDFTDIRRAEQMRRDFVANVSHELRTPLASIRAVIETLEGGALNDPEASRDFLSRAQTEVDRLTQLVAELLELSRIESGDVPFDREPVDIGKEVSEAVQRLRSQAERIGVGLRADVQPGMSAVLGDGDRIERAVVNLLHNALKFTPSGGQVNVTARESKNTITIQVSDNGVGIDERDLARIFERFYKGDRSRRAEGSGLGLSLVKHTVEAHGGSVAVESEPGCGSTFTISLPVMGTASPVNRADVSVGGRSS